MSGILEILNVGAGDTKISFDENNPEELKRAQGIIQDMLQRGFSIFVEVGAEAETQEPIYRRVRSFDPKTNEYIIAGGPETVEVTVESTAAESAADQARPTGQRRGRRAKKQTRKKAAESRAVSVGRTAGG